MTDTSNSDGEAIKLLRQDVLLPFDPARLAFARRPLMVADLSALELPITRLNHYLIKSSASSHYQYGDLERSQIARLLAQTWDYAALDLGIDLSDRYCYVTLDQGWVEPRETLRTPGWHVDGLQGDEVPVKQPGDLTFLWSDTQPTLFSTLRFNVDGLDLSRHNVFSWLEYQARHVGIESAAPGFLYAIGPYQVHQGNWSQHRTYRRFVRVSYTHVPVTSVKMTVNPKMHYNYAYHTTSGEIPAHLV